MRLATRLIQALPLLLPGAAALLGGCFTTLSHPEVTAPAGAATAERWHINLADNCASCHTADRHIRSVADYRQLLEQPDRSRRLLRFETFPWWYDDRAFESGRYGYGYLDEPQLGTPVGGGSTLPPPSAGYAPPLGGPVPQMPTNTPTRGYGGPSGGSARSAPTPAAEPARGTRTDAPAPAPVQTDTTTRSRERVRPSAPQTPAGSSGDGRSRG